MHLLIAHLPEETKSPKGSVERIFMTWDERRKPRRKYITDKGNEVALALPRGTTLTDGTVLYDVENRMIIVRAQEEPVVVIKPANTMEVCVIAHHLGNWHRSLQLGENSEILAEKDSPLIEWLNKQKIQFTCENRVFQPLLAVSGHN